jgi:putative serine protease PepD
MRRFGGWLGVIGGAVAGGVIALALTSGTSHSSVTTTTVLQTTSRIPTAFSQSHGLSVNQIYRMDSPGVVDIRVTSQTNNGFFGTQQSEGEGAGVVYDTKGDIITDEHVVTGATSVTVTFQDGKQVGAKVLDTDPSTDVAVIKVNVPASELHPIAFANSSNAQVGDPVVAIGSPFSLPETTTAGIVSQTGRSITAPNGFQITGSIQTDAAINPGNSGGPLLDAEGQVLGLNDQIQTNSGSSAGVGFATPANTDARIANAIIAGHPIKHAYVGVSLNQYSVGGAGVSQVRSGSPAASAGLRPGDLITAIDGKPISSTENFIATIDTYSPGQAVTLTIKRGGQTKQIRVTLGTRPSSAPSGG